MPVQDRAVVVTASLFLMLGIRPHPPLRKYVESWLRDEFAEERQQGVCDRELPDA